LKAAAKAIERRGGYAAPKGSAVHKTLQCMGKKKVCLGSTWCVYSAG
jgi:hypothetical protein